jgi:hypothetical protein
LFGGFILSTQHPFSRKAIASKHKLGRSVPPSKTHISLKNKHIQQDDYDFQSKNAGSKEEPSAAVSWRNARPRKRICLNAKINIHAK